VLFLKGASGSGKSTLLGLLAGILKRNPARSPCSAKTCGHERARRDAFRAARLGVIFQMFNLLPYLPVGAQRHPALPVLPARAKAAEAAGGARGGGPPPARAAGS
jgi:putative ABC transport system ATP-binding protein